VISPHFVLDAQDSFFFSVEAVTALPPWPLTKQIADTSLSGFAKIIARAARDTYTL